MNQGLQLGMTRGEALKALRTRLALAGADQEAVDARLLLCAAAGLKSADLIRAPEIALGQDSLQRLETMAARRAAGEPVSRILSAREFWGLPLAISPDVLDPRPDTETLVEAVVKELGSGREAPLRILDLGAGSGAILCALLQEFRAARGIAVDLCPRAAAKARANLAACGFAARADVVVGSWGHALRGPFDVVVANPPYIPSRDIDGLAREVRLYDPRLALDGGLDGLDAYRAICPQLRDLLGQGGRLFVEIGAGQAVDVATILTACGLAAPTLYADLAGLTRVVASAFAEQALPRARSAAPDGNKAFQNMPLGAE
jgi:release factor glutamine methyltransferase